MIQHTTKWKFTTPEEVEKATKKTLQSQSGSGANAPPVPGLWARKFGFHAGTCEACLKTIGGDAATKGGKVSKGNRRAAWAHLRAEETRISLTTAPMQLVGKIHKQRVTNEVWIFSAYGDMPDTIASRVNTKYNITDALRAVPWILALRNSKGWQKWMTRYTYREQAYAAGLDMLNEAFIDGHEIEVASEIDMDTIKVPIGAVETYLTALVDEAKATDKPKDLVELQTRLKKARGMLELLEAAQELVQSKLVGIDVPDSRYTEYEYDPNDPARRP